MLSDRKKDILRAVVDDYISTAEPVGSKAVAQRLLTPVSSATVRNEMADLTTLGYLEQPHTSAGRVPSSKGYRLYVDELMGGYSLSKTDLIEVGRSLSFRMRELDRLIIEAGRMVSELTHHPAIAINPTSPKERIRRFELISVDAHTVVLVLVTTSDTIKNRICRLTFPLGNLEIAAATKALNTHFTEVPIAAMTEDKITAAEFETGASISEILVAAIDFALEVIRSAAKREVFIEGELKLLDFPEFKDPARAKELLDCLDSEDAALLPALTGDGELKITIGEEHEREELADASIIVAPYGNSGLIGVVGPTRMDYAKVSARLKKFAQGLSDYIDKTKG